ncbi:hypothetical protein RB195_016428 [Necator americanus]|uniref:Uncharacterized protein n=1 Tax=Necator americanus TaxID=51031 RepID=A0ABR1C0F6_NECAM
MQQCATATPSIEEKWITLMVLYFASAQLTVTSVMRDYPHLRRGVSSSNTALPNLLDLLRELAQNQSIRRYSIFCETLRLA